MNAKTKLLARDAVREINRTLAWLGYEPEDVEYEVEKPLPEIGGKLIRVHWSAQTTVGDLTGALPMRTDELFSPFGVRRLVSDAALRKDRRLCQL